MQIQMIKFGLNDTKKVKKEANYIDTLLINKAIVSAAQLSGAQSARSFCLSVISTERERKLALIFALKIF